MFTLLFLKAMLFNISASSFQLTCNGRKHCPTKKFAVQLTTTAIEAAIGLADWLKSSFTKNQGMDPGPVAKPTTNKMTKMMEKYAEVGVCKENFVYIYVFLIPLHNSPNRL